MFMIAIVLLVVLMIPVAAVVLDSPVGRALASRIERKEGSALAEGSRMAALETEVERLGKEVNRLEEEATFLRQLLTEKPKRPELPPGGES
jgi:hypothetical protein